MQEVYEFLKECGVYYLATEEGGQPRVRPFSSLYIFENKLYIQTGKSKKVGKEMHDNPKIEICALNKGKWIRVEAKAIEDDRIEAKKYILEHSTPAVRKMYRADDDNTDVLYLKEVTATISSFGEEPKVIKF